MRYGIYHGGSFDGKIIFWKVDGALLKVFKRVPGWKICFNFASKYVGFLGKISRKIGFFSNLCQTNLVHTLIKVKIFNKNKKNLPSKENSWNRLGFARNLEIL